MRLRLSLTIRLRLSPADRRPGQAVNSSCPIWRRASAAARPAGGRAEPPEAHFQCRNEPLQPPGRPAAGPSAPDARSGREPRACAPKRGLNATRAATMLQEFKGAPGARAGREPRACAPTRALNATSAATMLQEFKGAPGATMGTHAHADQAGNQNPWASTCEPLYCDPAYGPLYCGPKFSASPLLRQE